MIACRKSTACSSYIAAGRLKLFKQTLVLMALGKPNIFGLLKLAAKQPFFLAHMIEKKIRFARRYRLARQPGADDDVPLPLVYKLVLTQRCNLRCPMCYEWGSTGWKSAAENHTPTLEMDWAVIERILDEAKDSRPSFILIGGEPLLYSRFSDLVLALKERKCFSICCTNGMFLDKHLQLFEHNPYLTLLVSLDGLGPVNDAIRGAGVYDKVTSSISELKKLRHPPYVGIQHTLRPENISGMSAFCEAMVKAGADWILFNPTWFVTEEERADYSQVLETRFKAPCPSLAGYAKNCAVDPHLFLEQYELIKSRTWPIQISCYFKDSGDIFDYLNEHTADDLARPCLKQWLRMDVLPNGDVTPCALYPDLSFGNLNKDSVRSAWNSARYAEFRRWSRNASFSVCRKCDVFYLYDANRKIL